MLELRNISKSYGEFSLQEFSLNIADGEYFVLLGRSGSGKSVTLELISGLHKPDKGSIFLNGRDITAQKIQERKIGIVFQDFALFPHMTVFDNVAYSLKMKRLTKARIRRKVLDISTKINIEHILDRKPGNLSGGEKQRVAVARTLVTSPDIILLDEPMASIDTPLRDDVRRLFRKINQEGMSIMHVTHDYREAIRLADRVGVIHNGRLIQVDKPDDVFSKPVNRFVARFAGIRNFFKVNIEREIDGYVGTGLDGFRFLLPEGIYPENGIIMIRSNDILISNDEPELKENFTSGIITEMNRAEFGYEAYIIAEETFYVTFSKQTKEELNMETGKNVFISFRTESLNVL